jgi:hypothetical protein
MLNLEIVNDEAAEAFVARCLCDGARDVAVLSDGTLRVVRSIDPIGPGGKEEAHVSVSISGKPVKKRVALAVAQQLFRGVVRWELTHSATCTHVWGKF